MVINPSVRDADLCFPKSQIPEEEKNIGPNDRLILVYHFAKETGQNQVTISIPSF